MDPSTMVLVFVAVVVLLALLVLTSRRPQRGGPAPYPYQRRELFSAAERSFLGVLDRAIAGDLRVFAKVRLIDIVKVRPGLTRSEHGSAKNRIVAKHVDFVLCTTDDLRTLAVLELDDASHATDRARRRDDLVDATLSAAGIPVHRFEAKRSYSVLEIRHELAPLLAAAEPEAVHADATRAREPLPGSVEPEPAAAKAAQDDAAEAGSPVAAVPTCPKCGSEMVRRVAKRGPKAGTPFLACSRYPDCRSALDLPPDAPEPA